MHDGLLPGWLDALAPWRDAASLAQPKPEDEARRARSRNAIQFGWVVTPDCWAGYADVWLKVRTSVLERSGEFGSLLQRHRLAAGLSQEELAERAGLSRRGISDLERGERRTPHPATARRLARALNLAAPDRAAFLVAAREIATSEPAASASTRRPAPPIPLTSFVGRDHQLRELQAQLTRSHLVTLTGAGGMGKTRLALEVAGRLAAHSPIGWVDLAPVDDPGVVPQVVADSLGIAERPGSPLVETLIEHLKRQRLLLVVDNCEHLIEACAFLLRRLLGACSELRVLATSREPLRLAGEVTWIVPPLAYVAPQPGTLADLVHVPAVALFMDRARAHRPDFVLGDRNARAIGDIVEQLEGMPLAIELAAAWVTVLPPEQIARRLNDALRLLVDGDRGVPRHASLRVTLDWSYALLDETERRLFRCLAVFAGGFDLEAAEAVCAPAAGPCDDVLGLLAHLVNKSLVVVEPITGAGSRYHLPETVRQYGQERLTRDGELRAVQLRHAEYFVCVAEAAEPHVWTPDGARGIERDYANLRAALTATIRYVEPELGLRLAGALGRFWNRRGPFTEPCHWLEDLLSLGGTVRPSVRAKALVWVGALLQTTGDYASGAVRLREGLAVANECDDRYSAAQALYSLAGSAANNEHNYTLASELLQQSLDLRRSVGDQLGATFALNNLGHVALHAGDYDRAAALIEESLALRRELGHREGMANSIQSLAMLARQRGDYARATELFRESLRHLHELGIVRGVLIGLVWQAGALAATGQHERAARILGGFSAASEAVGFSPPLELRSEQQATLDVLRESLGRHAFDAAWAEGNRLSLDDLVALALGS